MRPKTRPTWMIPIIVGCLALYLLVMIGFNTGYDKLVAAVQMAENARPIR